MAQKDERDQQIAALRDRLSKLGEASLRINESLDFETVLQGVLDSARALTDSRYGVITVFEETGEMQAFLASGMTREQALQLWEVPGAMQFFELLREIREPLRLRDFHSHTRSLGLPEFRPPMPVSEALSFLASPVRHGGESVGNIYLGEKSRGREYTEDDESTLVMFASQAALVIGNARSYRDEQRARTNLETLINTSPVGVVVFDAITGKVLSFNREAARILEVVRIHGRHPERLLEVMTIRRADGREFSLQELSVAQAMRPGETVRAEEVVFRVPDGREVTALMNATPIRTDDDCVGSFVVTLQDMTPLEKLERLRAEFLGMVSHELRVPLTSIKGSTTTLLDTSTVLDPAEARQFYRIIDHQADRMRDLISDLLDVAQIETGSLSVAPEPTDLAGIVDQARNTFLSGGGRNSIDIDLPSDLPWVMADRRRIVQVLNNLISNAARYSEASSGIRLTAVREDFHVTISVADEGAGVTADLLPHIFRKFSRTDTANGERRTPDTGLGLAICKGIVEAHGGRVWAESDGPGRGTTLSFTVPAAEEIPGGSVPDTVRTTEHSRDPRGPGDKILVVDDDPQTLKYVRDTLTRAGYTPIVTADPEQVARYITSDRPQLVLLDLLLPGADGIELMEGILEVTEVPVIFLSAYGRDETIARAFESGATDYVVKPFSPTELVARIKSALRRAAGKDRAEPERPYVLGDLNIDYSERRVTVAGRRVSLSPGEYRLLYELSVSPSRALTHQLLLKRVWGLRNSGDVRLVRALVKRLRRKLGDDANDPRYIVTEHGVGYRMGKPEEIREASSQP